MLVLFETPAGYSLFKVTDSQKLAKTDTEDIFDQFFGDSHAALQTMQLVSFQAFADTADAVAAATSLMDGKVNKSLKNFLKKKLKKLDATAATTAAATTAAASQQLAVADKALAVSLKDAAITPSSCKIVHDSKTQELFRGIRCYMEQLLDDNNNADNNADHHHHHHGCGISAHDLHAMQLGLSHSLSRYKLKFSADKVDTMVIQAVGLLDELDKEINTYAMRVKEWYGWHFPELQALVNDNAAYSQLVLKCGMRPNYKMTDLSSILQDETQEAAVKEAAEISMGTEIADLDILNIRSLAEQVLSMTEYRSQLFEYLRNRMNAIAPNLTILVGELVGARLIAHAGSLMNLAKQPASTVQILGAEKALFRALKTKHDTPKYGLIYHASLIGQAAPKNKGKISRVLAAKAALAIRVDALSDDTTTTTTTGVDGEEEQQQHHHGPDTTIGFEGRAKVEARLRQLEGGGAFVAATSNLTAQKTAKYNAIAAKSAAQGTTYQNSSDMVMMEETVDDNDADDDDDDDDTRQQKKKKKNAKADTIQQEEESSPSKKKKKKDKKKSRVDDNGEAVEKSAKKSKKRKAEDENGDDEEKKSAKKKKKKKSKE